MAKVNSNRTIHPHINIDESASNVSTLSLLPYHHSQSLIHANNTAHTDQSETDIIKTNDCFNNFDRSRLGDIDPDSNYLINTNQLKDTIYFTEQSFNIHFNKPSKFSIFLYNMRSLPDHFRELLCYLDTLKFNFKVLALTETWLKSYHTNYVIPNYNFEQDLRMHSRGGGVCLYLHSALQYRIRNDLRLVNSGKLKHSKCNPSRKNPIIHKEINSIFVEIDKKNTATKHNIIVGCIYRPPCYPIIEFNELIGSLLDKLEKENKHIYITGDFNCDILLTDKHSELFKNLFLSSHFYPLINQPTRITNNTATLIDNIYCNIPNLQSNVESGLLHVNIADHKGVFCINNDSELFSRNTTKSKRVFNKKNIAQFNKSLINESWEYAYSSDFKSAFSRFQQTFDRYFDKSFPVLTYKINYKNRHTWMTEQLRSRIKQKNSLYLTVLKHPGDIKLKEQYKRQKNELNSDIKNTEINYYSNELELHKENLRKTWKIMKSIIGKDMTNSNQNRSFCINGKSTTNVSKIVLYSSV